MARGLVSQQSLIDTANAIRFSTEDSTKMLPSEMPDNIRSIEGKVVALPKGRVNFYNYDGELLYSYSPKEFIEKGVYYTPGYKSISDDDFKFFADMLLKEKLDKPCE